MTKEALGERVVEGEIWRKCVVNNMVKVVVEIVVES